MFKIISDLLQSLVIYYKLKRLLYVRTWLIRF